MNAIVLSIILTAIAVLSTTAFHFETLTILSRRYAEKTTTRRALPGIILCIIAAHLIEIGFYAFIFFVAQGGLHLGTLGPKIDTSAFENFYFAAETYSSLGYGDIFPTGAMRLIAAIEPLNGILMLTWSGSFLFMLVQKGDAKVTKTRRIILRVSAFLLIGGCAILFALAYVGYFSVNAVTIVPPQGTTKADYSIVFLSGDLGFNMGMGPKITQHFTDEGVPVVALNSLTFFRQERTRVEVDQLVRDLMKTARNRFGIRKLVLIGHSFGAEVLQLGLADLSAKERTDIMQVVMIVPTDDAYLQAQPDGHYRSRPADYDAIPTAHKLNWVPMLCIHGDQETGSLCPKLNLKNADIKTLPGGHNLKLNDDLIYRTIQQGVDAVDGKTS